MREILYFQAGNFANFIGTHFWNAQESYFTYGEDAEEPFVDHNVSFREGLNERGEPTFCPRLLLFDRKSNFGSLTDVYGEDAQSEADNALAPWNGDVVEYRSEPILRSDYHSQLDAQEQEDAHTPTDPEGVKVEETKIRYWSDSSRVLLHRRSVHRLPDPPEWEDLEGDWIAGSETFQKYDDDNDFMEESFRMFVEECDYLQGLQLMNDASTFGSFTNSFLSRFRDDFPKLACLSFPILSGCVPGRFDADDARSIKKALNDALLLQGLSELSTVTVPVQPPTAWSPGPWSDALDIKFDSIYQTSALLSTHIENVTLPARLKQNPTDLTSIAAALSWRNDTLFANLQGQFPLPNPYLPDTEKKLYNLSAAGLDFPTRVDTKSIYARLDVSRGLSESEISSYSQWTDTVRPSPYTVHAPAINIPTSYPKSFRTSVHLHTAKGLSTLSSPSSLASLFGAYSSVAKDCMSRHADVVTRMGLEADDVKELRDTLWALEDAYRGDEEDTLDETDNLGEDEEY